MLFSCKNWKFMIRTFHSIPNHPNHELGLITYLLGNKNQSQQSGPSLPVLAVDEKVIHHHHHHHHRRHTMIMWISTRSLLGGGRRPEVGGRSVRKMDWAGLEWTESTTHEPCMQACRRVCRLTYWPTCLLWYQTLKYQLVWGRACRWSGRQQ